MFSVRRGESIQTPFFMREQELVGSANTMHLVRKSEHVTNHD